MTNNFFLFLPFCFSSFSSYIYSLRLVSSFMSSFQFPSSQSILFICYLLFHSLQFLFLLFPVFFILCFPSPSFPPLSPAILFRNFSTIPFRILLHVLLLFFFLFIIISPPPHSFFVIFCFLFLHHLQDHQLQGSGLLTSIDLTVR
jgi:hypothetical protein